MISCSVRLKKKTHVIVKLKVREKRYNIMVNRSKLKGKNNHLKRNSFKDAVFINESMSPGYKYLHDLCHRLLRARSLMVNDLHLETKGSRFESGC